MNLFDLHCDTALSLYKKNLSLTDNDLHISLDRSAKYPHYAQVMAIWSDKRLDDRAAYRQYHHAADYFLRQADAHRNRAMICRTSGEGYAHGADALGCWDFASRLHRITCPVLTLAGADDQSTPPEVVHAIADKVSGPATTVTVPGGHVPTVESADAVNSALAEFLK